MQKRRIYNSFTLALISLSMPYAHAQRWLGDVCGGTLENNGDQNNGGDDSGNSKFRRVNRCYRSVWIRLNSNHSILISLYSQLAMTMVASELQGS